MKLFRNKMTKQKNFDQGATRGATEFQIEVKKTNYGYLVPLPTTEWVRDYGAHRFNYNERGVVTLMSTTGGPQVFHANVSPYRKVGDTWVAENLCAGLNEYLPGTLEHAAFEALITASERNE